jgi:hypothetical protein
MQIQDHNIRFKQQDRHEWMTSPNWDTYYKNNRSGNLSLKMLLNPSSPYHSDFMPVYRNVTKLPG